MLAGLTSDPQLVCLRSSGLFSPGLGPVPWVCPHGILPSPQPSSSSSIQAAGACSRLVPQSPSSQGCPWWLPEQIPSPVSLGSHLSPGPEQQAVHQGSENCWCLTDDYWGSDPLFYSVIHLIKEIPSTQGSFYSIIQVADKNIQPNP